MSEASMSRVVVSKELFSFLAPVLYVSRIFGLAPMKWTKSDEANVAISKSLPWLIYSFTFTFLLVAISIYGLNQTYQIDVIYNIRLGHYTGRYVTLSDMFVNLFSGLFGVVVTSMTRNKSQRFLHCIREIDMKMPKTSQRHHMTAVSLLLTTFVLCLDLGLWTRLAYRYDAHLFKIIRNLLPYYLCYYYTIIMELKYWAAVKLVHFRIEKLNELLRKMEFEAKIDKRAINVIVDSLNAVPHHLNKHLITPDSVGNLIRIFHKLSEASDLLNETYGLLILFVVVGCLIHLLVTPYSLYALIANTGDSNFIVSQSIWMFGHVLRLLLIVEPCHSCMMLTKTTAHLVCELLLADLGYDVKKQLEIFALNLNQLKIDFTVHGLATIDRQFLTTISGAVTTYLVILFQFNKTDE